VEEYPTDLVSITVAQRYSVLVTARNDTSENWVIHANMDTVMFDKVPPLLKPSGFSPVSLPVDLTTTLPDVTSSITYNSSAPLTNLGTITEYYDLNDTALVPIPAIPQPPPASQTIELEVMFSTMSDGTNRAMVNQVTFNSPLVPSVLSELSLGPNATVASAYVPLSFVLNHLDVFDIVLKNADSGKHPL
jgi:iron transport multicopper oxidase